MLPAFGGTADAGISVAGGDETVLSADLRAAFFAGALAGLATGFAAGSVATSSACLAPAFAVGLETGFEAGFGAGFGADFAAGFAGLVTAGTAVFCLVALAALPAGLSVCSPIDAEVAAASFAAVDATDRVARASVVFLAVARRAVAKDSAIAFTSAGASGTADNNAFPVRLAVGAGCLCMATTLEGGGDFLLMEDPESG